jgi:ubiquinone/menaquinone biosynthesis C-methylase UbiE
LSKYAERQKKFWNVSDRDVARFERVHLTDDRTQEVWNALARRDARLVLDGIHPTAEWTMLEIGCGVGRILAEVRNTVAFRRLIGLDLSETMIRFARETLGPDERIELGVNSGYDLAAVANEQVDFAYSVDVFIHISDIDVACSYIREAHRVLKEGGFFRFNVRYFDVDRAFENSPGGMVAKGAYKLGIWGHTSQRWSPSQEAEFNGIQYTLRDLRRTVAQAGSWSAAEFQVRDERIWCVLRK